MRRLPPSLIASLSSFLLLSPALRAEDAPAPPRSTRDDLSLELVLSDPAIATPIALDVDARGRVWVIESNTHFQPSTYARHETDRILVLEDDNGDGSPERIDVFTDGLEQTMALSLDEERSGDGALFVATRRDVRLLRDSDGDGRADQTTFLARLETRGDYPHNGLSGFAFDGLGNLYFAIGENLAVAYRLSGADGRSLVGGPDGGSIFRMRLDGSALERWAIGFWNTFHLACDPFGRLFAVDNDPDSRPPCRLLHIVRGGDYGYRRWLGRKGLHPFTAWNGELPGTLPMVSGTGEAPSGILWYARSGLPSDLRGKFLVTSWGDHRVSVYGLERNGTSFRSHPEPVVVGGEDFRPVGIAAAPDGTVYFSDWVLKDYPVHGHGRIWRLRSREYPTGRPANPPAAVVRYRSLRARARDGALGEALAPALEDPSAAIRAAAIRLACETGEISDPMLFEIVRSEEEPEVLLEALVAIAHRAPHAGPNLSNRLEELAIEEDPFVAAAALRALARTTEAAALEGRARELVARRGPAEEGPKRLALLLALRGAGEVRSRQLVPAFLDDPDPAVRRAALQWAGEDRLFEHRGRIGASLTSGSPTREVLDAYLAARSLLAGESPEERDRIFRDDALRAMAEDRALPPELRALAIRSIARRGARLELGLLQGLLSSHSDPSSPLRLDAVRAIIDAVVEGGASVLSREARNEANPLGLRREATAGLAAFLDDAAVEAELESLAREDGAPVAEEARRALRLGRSATTREAEVPDREALIAGGPGDAAAGELLFFHPRGPRCALCHTIAGRGGVVGPDLSRAGILERERLVDSVLTPSKEVAPQFVQWVVVTPGGVVAGTLLREEADGTLVLATAEGRLERISPGQIVERSTSSASVMPEGLLERLRPDEIRNLLAYLEGLR